MSQIVVALSFLCLAGVSLTGINLAAEEQYNLMPFQSDGCTMFYDGDPSDPEAWKHCCFEHDLFFWAGGSRNHRDLADLNLRQCVAETGHKKIADLMYKFVRLGSHSPWKFGRKQWGNAWSDREMYTPINADEKLQIERELLGYEISDEIKAKLLRSFGI